jgi:hypothetical protein
MDIRTITYMVTAIDPTYAKFKQKVDFYVHKLCITMLFFFYLFIVASSVFIYCIIPAGIQKKYYQYVDRRQQLQLQHQQQHPPHVFNFPENSSTTAELYEKNLELIKLNFIPPIA